MSSRPNFNFKFNLDYKNAVINSKFNKRFKTNLAISKDKVSYNRIAYSELNLLTKNFGGKFVALSY